MITKRLWYQIFIVTGVMNLTIAETIYIWNVYQLIHETVSQFVWYVWSIMNFIFYLGLVYEIVIWCHKKVVEDD